MNFFPFIPISTASTSPLTGTDFAFQLLNMGGTAGILYVCIWFLAKVIAKQNESRIESLERRSEECEKDRKELHRQLQNLLMDDRARMAEKLDETQRVKLRAKPSQ